MEKKSKKHSKPSQVACIKGDENSSYTNNAPDKREVDSQVDRLKKRNEQLKDLKEKVKTQEKSGYPEYLVSVRLHQFKKSRSRSQRKESWPRRVNKKMDSLPLIAKSKITPNLDVTSLIREIFQTEFESYVPSKKLSESLRKSLEYEKLKNEYEGQESFRSVNLLEDLANEKRKLMDYAEKILEAYRKHEEALNRIAKVELNIVETQAIFIRREENIKKNDLLKDLLKTKKRPLMRCYNPEYVKEFKLLQGDAALPANHEAGLDFRIKDYQMWRKRLSSHSEDNLLPKCLNRTNVEIQTKAIPRKIKRERISRPKRRKWKREEPNVEFFRAEPPAVYFTDYTPGSVYSCRITVRNVHTKPMKFLLKPFPTPSPFKVEIHGAQTTRILPGLTFKLFVTFEPRSLDEENENVRISIEGGSTLIIPLTSYLEPPVLKTHEDIDERTKTINDRIRSSYIECGACFPGDSKITKLRFFSAGGAGEFFLMSQENWTNWHIDCLTPDNFTDVQAFRFYPAYFKLDKDQVIDLYVEFKPPTFGLHSDNIVIACSNGEVRNLDVLGDGVAWNRSFLTFEETLEKNFPLFINDDHRAVYYLDMGHTLSSGRTGRTFCITNNSSMPFEFRWEMRDIVVPFKGQDEFGKLSTTEVKIEPCSQIFEPYTSHTFVVSVNFQKRPVGQYRTVLSLYVIGLPYKSIEQASTIIRPSVLHRRFKSRSELGEEDNLLLSPECSYQDTYESIQEGIKSSGNVRHQQQQFPAMVCRKNPGICAVPLKKTKTYSNIGGNVDACTSSPTRTTEAVETVKNYECDSLPRKPDITELGSDLLWDFVDVLVDEIELWAEVVPTITSIEPWIVNFYDDVRLNEPPVKHEVYIHNHNNCTVTCKWLKSYGEQRISSAVSKTEVSTAYLAQGLSKKEDPDPENVIPEYGEDGGWDHITDGSVVSAPQDDYQITCYATQKGCAYAEMIPDAITNQRYEIQADPVGLFEVAPHSRYRCTISVSATEPGIINAALNLVIEDEEPMQLHVIGRVPDREISIFPQILDFGVRRRGTRYTKHFKIKNETKDPVEWKVELYNFSYGEQILTGPTDEEQQSSLKNLTGTLEQSGCTIESYKLDARKPGLKTNILRFGLSSPVYSRGRSKYLMVLADVQTPKLAIEAPRFENAILAPNRTMYVRQMITQNITLRNMKNVATTFIWGYPFGCHCRKLKIDIRPKLYVIGGFKNMAIQVNITPLEEGIVEHCYIPCFFSRNVDPVLLSIVGVVENVRVMFEVTQESLHLCRADTKTKASVMKITWPIRDFDPTIGMSYIPENKILDFICHCDEVDAEHTRKAEKHTSSIEEGKHSNENAAESYGGEEDERGGEEDNEQELKQACTRKYYTPARMRELRSEIMRKKGVNTGYAEEISEEDYERSESVMKEVDTGSAVSVEYLKKSCIELLYYAASELQFLNMLYKTVSVKYFVIRNLSPVSVSFNLRVRYFARVDRKDKIREIRNRVFGSQKDEFEESMIYGQPLVITTSPAEGILEGWQSIRVSVFAYGNTWGEYRDFITCNISGMPPFVVKVFAQLSGHPVLFPMFKTSLLEIPVFRFGAVRYKSEPVPRSIRVRNTSSIPITVTWMVFITSPVPHDSKEEPFSLCLDLYTDKESEDPEKATKSSHNYLSKNTSGSIPLFDAFGTEKSYSPSTGNAPASEMESGKKDGPMLRGCESDLSPKTVSDSTKPEIQILEYFGKVDLRVFQISPRELDLKPYSEERITITFDPSCCDPTIRLQDYEAVVTGCVRLKQEHAHYPNIYHRSCGKDYVSKLLCLSANVEKPFLSFEISKNDLKYILNANEVLKAKECRQMKKYIVRNRCQTPVSVLVKLKRGAVFSIKRICSFKEVFQRDKRVTIDPGSSIEIHLEMSITHSQLLEMYKMYEIERPRRRKPAGTKSSDLILEGAVVSKSDSDEEIESEEGQKLYGSSTSSCSSSELCDPDSKFGVKALDSYLMIESRSRNWKSTSHMEEDIFYTLKKRENEDCYGEGFVEGPTTRVHADTYDTRQLEFSFTVREDLVFDQVGLFKQVITPELRIYFPFLKLNPDLIDFGDVYIGEASTRYSSVTNLTQFPTVFTVTESGETNEFLVRPILGYLPATNYKSDTGAQLEVKFAPKEPGYFKKTFYVYGNAKMEFECFALTVLGFGTWDEKYKYPRIESRTKLPMVLPFTK